MSARQACHPRKEESHPDTGEGLLSCIFTAHQSGPCHIARTPGDPLIQDSLKRFCYIQSRMYFANIGYYKATLDLQNGNKVFFSTLCLGPDLRATWYQLPSS